MASLELADVTAGVIFVALTIYALLAGADFGAGVWEYFARGPGAAAQRELLRSAIGPVWEANHVWMIVVIVCMFTGFPRAFAAIGVALHVPLLLMLVGMVFRGSAFVFSAYAPQGVSAFRWRRVFAAASVLTPVLLGVTLGTIASGRIRFDQAGRYVSGYFEPWLKPFPWAVGGFALAVFAYLAAVYLCVEAEDDRTREAFRRRALLAGVAVGAAAGATWLLARGGAPLVYQRLASSWWTWPLQIATGAAAVGALAALWRRRYALARTLAAVQTVCILGGYAAGQWPYLVVPDVR
ncbi:MAG: cytochrome d ubiquinol oxidase subunit II, partial [Planctomycetota bacterium]